MKDKFSSLVKVAVLGSMLLMALVLPLSPSSVQAHCDSKQGPVAAAARQALEERNIDAVLPYVAPEYEVELTAVFEQALEVRELSESAQVLAEDYFIETAIRLHRMSEGAAYTGVTDEVTPDAIILADEVMATGEMDELYLFLDTQIQHGLSERYNAVIATRQHAAEEGTVAANRERVTAELMFEKYVYELYLATEGTAEHHAEGAAHQE